MYQKNFLTFDTKINWKEIININARINTIKLLEKTVKFLLTFGWQRCLKYDSKGKIYNRANKF